ncbi:MAG: FKBP-type peptidyl-prolyl cis-trans isomerase [Candidatus Micrarchaeia archaeon]
MEKSIYTKLAAVLAAFIFFAFALGCAGQGGSRQAKPGDTVLVNYVLRGANGTVIETNEETIARNFNIYSATDSYQPLQVVLKQGNGLLPAFTNAIINMSVGQTRELKIPAGEAYPYNKSLVFDIPVEFAVPRIVQVALTPEEMASLKIAQGSTVTNKKYGWKMTVVNVMPDGKTVVFMQNPTINQFFYNDGGWPTYVKNFTDSEIDLALIVQNGTTYGYSDPAACPTGKAKVIGQDNSTITLDCNHELAGMGLDFDITLVSIASNSSGSG